MVLAEKVLPQPAHSHLCAPPAERPFLVNLGHPHLGHFAGSPAAPAASSSAIAAFSSETSSSFSSTLMPSTICCRIAFMGLPFSRVSLAQLP